ncbi:MAG: DUF423 domain-containing protein [Burkholderiales bacterium]|jgi:uncharacterized membrane protein YgdD (TMEM256/DUF423 family)|nr:DUF423 domain-containing protein [Burkholderiales bacterium]
MYSLIHKVYAASGGEFNPKRLNRKCSNTPRRLLFLSGFLLVLGLAFFCGDLARRTFLGLRLFSMAAPIGGGAMMLGWVFLVLAALMPRRW